MADQTDPLGRPIAEEPETDEAREARRLASARSLEKANARIDADVLRTVMHSRNGRDWLYRTLEAAHIFGSVADLGTRERNADPFVTYYRDGERNFGNRLLQDAQRASGQLFQQMIDEQNAKREQREDSEN